MTDRPEDDERDEPGRKWFGLQPWPIIGTLQSSMSNSEAIGHPTAYRWPLGDGSYRIHPYRAAS
jgi:hypothetical protein